LHGFSEKGVYNFYTNSGKVKLIKKTMGLVMVCSNGTMPPVNFDPARDNNMTSNLIDQDSFAGFDWLAAQSSWPRKTNNYQLVFDFR